MASFTRKNTAEDVLAGISLSDKIIVLTGANAGIGFESLKAFTNHGAHVIALARTEEKARAACKGLEHTTTPMGCDLSNLDEVARCSDAIMALDKPIDVLLCNAGVCLAPLELKYGVESHFLVNHLAHYLLIRKLLPLLERAEQGRILTISSRTHAGAGKLGIDFDNLDGSKGYSDVRFYGQSKLASNLTAKALTKRLQRTSVTANALTPGITKTDMARDAGGLSGFFQKLVFTLVGKTAAQGAATQCYLAGHPEVSNISGEYFHRCAVTKASSKVDDDELVERLWAYSESFLAEYL